MAAVATRSRSPRSRVESVPTQFKSGKAKAKEMKEKELEKARLKKAQNAQSSKARALLKGNGTELFSRSGSSRSGTFDSRSVRRRPEFSSNSLRISVDLH